MNTKQSSTFSFPEEDNDFELYNSQKVEAEELYDNHQNLLDIVDENDDDGWYVQNVDPLRWKSIESFLMDEIDNDYNYEIEHQLPLHQRGVKSESLNQEEVHSNSPEVLTQTADNSTSNNDISDDINGIYESKESTQYPFQNDSRKQEKGFTSKIPASSSKLSYKASLNENECHCSSNSSFDRKMLENKEEEIIEWKPFTGSIQDLEQTIQPISEKNESHDELYIKGSCWNMVALVTLLCYSTIITILFCQKKQKEERNGGETFCANCSSLLSSPLKNVNEKRATQEKNMTNSITSKTSSSNCYAGSEIGNSSIAFSSFQNDKKMKETRELKTQTLTSSPYQITTTIDNHSISTNNTTTKQNFVEQVQSLSSAISSTGLNRQTSLKLANKTLIRKLELEYMNILQHETNKNQRFQDECHRLATYEIDERRHKEAIKAMLFHRSNDCSNKLDLNMLTNYSWTLFPGSSHFFQCIVLAWLSQNFSQCYNFSQQLLMAEDSISAISIVLMKIVSRACDCPDSKKDVINDLKRQPNKHSLQIASTIMKDWHYSEMAYNFVPTIFSSTNSRLMGAVSYVSCYGSCLFKSGLAYIFFYITHRVLRDLFYCPTAVHQIINIFIFFIFILPPSVHVLWLPITVCNLIGFAVCMNMILLLDSKGKSEKLNTSYTTMYPNSQNVLSKIHRRINIIRWISLTVSILVGRWNN